MEKAKYFGYSGERVKGLIFCSRLDEGEELSKKFNEKGWKTLVLSGKNSEEQRAEAIERLVNDELELVLFILIKLQINRFMIQ